MLPARDLCPGPCPTGRALGPNCGVFPCRSGAWRSPSWPGILFSGELSLMSESCKIKKKKNRKLGESEELDGINYH